MKPRRKPPVRPQLEREWKLSPDHATALCRNCGGVIAFLRDAGGARVWCLDIDKSRPVKRGRMAPLHTCQRRTLPND